MGHADGFALTIDGHWYSFSELVTGSLLGIREAMRPGVSGPDVVRALSIAGNLFSILDQKCLNMEVGNLPAVGLPRPLVVVLGGKDGALEQLFDAAQERGLPESFIFFLINLKELLPQMRPCPRIGVERLPRQSRLAARSNGSDAQIDFRAFDLDDETSRRLLRIDIPVVSDGEWALYAADLNVDYNQPRTLDWPAYNYDQDELQRRVGDRTFESGVERGFAAAARLLGRLGKPPPEGKPRLMMRNVMPPALLTGGSVALPVAVETLRRGLELDPPLCVVSGAMDANYRVLPIDAEDAQYALGKLAAVLDEGSYDRLVAVTEQDLRQSGLDAIVGQSASLEDIAFRLWGAAYKQKVDAAIRHKLRDSGLAAGWDNTGTPKGDDIFVRTDKGARLAELICAAPRPTVWHIAGPARSGKTWMAWDVKERLEATGAWSVQILRAVADMIDPDDLIRGLREISTLLAEPVSPRANHLIVVDGLTYDQGMQELTSSVSSFVSEIRAHLLIVRTSDISSNWDPPGGAEVQSIFTVEDIAEFIDALGRQYGKVLAQRGITSDDFREDYAGAIGGVAHHRGLATDLFWICEHARSGHRLEDYRSWLMTAVQQHEFEALHRLAFATLYGIDCEEALCESLSLATRDRFQVKRSIDGLLRISQPIAAQMVLWDPGSAERDYDYLEQVRGADAILPIIAHVIDPPKTSPLAHMPTKLRRLTAIVCQLGTAWKTTLKLIFRGARIGDNWLEPQLYSAYPDAFNMLFKANFTNKPWDIAKLVLALHDALKTRDRLLLLCNLVRHLVTEAGAGNLELSCQRLLLCYKTVYEYQLDFLEATPLFLADTRDRDAIKDLQEKIELNWSAFLDQLARNGVTGRVIKAEKDLFQRLRLFEAMRELHMRDMLVEAVEVYGEIKKGLYSLNSRRFAFLKKLLDLVNTAVTSNTIVANDEALLREFKDTEADIRSIASNECELAFRKPDFKSISTFADWACLTIQCKGFELSNDIKSIAAIFDELAATSSARDTISAIGQIHNQLAPAVTNLLAESRMFCDASFISDGSAATLTDIADFLFSIQRWNILTARNMLYSQGPDPAPNEQLARLLARRIKEEGDLRNAGRVLRAVGQLDKIVVTDLGKGFGAQFLTHIGQEWLIDRIRRENRSSLIFYVVQGLVQIGHEWLRILSDDIVNHLKEAIADSRFHQWSATLCSFLLTDETTAPIFASPIINGRIFDSKEVCDGMENASNIEALEAYHTLGRMLPDIGADFVRRVSVENYAADLAQSLAAPRNGEQALRAIRTVGATYHQFNASKTATFLKQFNWDTLRSALRATSFGSVAMALTILAELDRDQTIQLVKSKAGAEILGYKLRLAWKTPEAAAQIVYACEKIEQRLGYTLLDLQGAAYRKILVDKLRGMQNPRSYAMSANMLELVRPGIGEHTATFFRVWVQNIEHIRSPAALVEILTLVRNLKEQGRSAALPYIAGSINAYKIAQRLSSYRLVEDLSFAPTLAMMLHEFEEIERATQLRKTLFEIAGIEKIVPEHIIFDIMRLAEETRTRVPDDLISQFDRHFLERGAAGWLLNPTRFWRAFGAYGLVRELHLESSWDPFDQIPPTLKALHDPATRVLATAALMPSQWNVAQSEEAWDEIQTTPSIVPWEMRHLTTALARDRSKVAKDLQAIAPTAVKLLDISPFSVSTTRYLAKIAQKDSGLA
ncbi:hypothetical protein C2U72_00970 [Prosthecomicrobium hirschii]|uniref:hypothetical protein n=1 Tax=Prosthecodimorpha hirschii TaxID=665126 RepID=UPI00112A8BE8|nr:hypothetical protein [Prosthecomicrobium hirschii]TPQ52871.1 hypothetical protein C2U72_00970 [Prosthecomicrobium hirschii]